MRAFIGIPLAPEIRGAIVPVQKRLAATGAHVTWVKPGNIHITMKFLGEIDGDPLELLKAGLLQIGARTAPFALDLCGIGSFPPRGAPRVIWVGCEGEVNIVAALAAEIERPAAEIGVPKEDRPFTAHATLGRVKSSRGAAALRNEMEKEMETAFGLLRVDSFVLFQSQLKPTGAEYSELLRVRLSAER